MGFYHPEDWPNTLLLGGTQLKHQPILIFSLQHFAGSTRDYTVDSSSWNGTWTSRHKLESSLHGSEVYGGQDSRALTKLPPDWLDWALHISYYRGTIFNQCRDHRGSTTSCAENYQSMTETYRVT